MAIARRGAAVPLAILAAFLLVLTSGVAGAAPQPTVAQVKQRLSQLNTKLEKLVQQYDQVEQELKSADQRLTLINTETKRYQARFDELRSQVAQIAAAAYEQGSLSAPTTLLTSGNPQQVLDQASILQELSATNAAQMNEFLAAARQLSSAQVSARRAAVAIRQLRDKLRGQKATLQKLISQQQQLLAQLTPAQQAGTGPGGGSSGGGNPKPPPVSGQAGKAVDFAFAQLGCPYVYGGTGPCQDGYDCSGLTQAAWAYAGVSIPRTSYEQWDELPHVPMSDIQPGDILVFNGAGHVGIYVGHNELIDAPHTGANVEEVSLSGWYAQTLDGAVRP